MDAIIVQAAGWIITIFIGAVAAIILWYIISGKIDLKHLISESNGQASLSRFQLLIFTFVIAMGLFLIIVGSDPLAFPEIPAGVFALLGISGGSYVLSKNIQAGRDAGKGGGGDPPDPGK